MALEIVRTKNGLVKGVVSEDHSRTVFRKIPYAKAPVGGMRFREAEMADAWDGVYDSTSWAPAEFQNLCAVPPYIKDFYFGPWPALSEDCLYLSVSTGASSEEERRPVYVWFHGGGLSTGFYFEPEFDPEVLTRKGIVVVSVGQRLNVFGYLALPQLRDENGRCGNYGFTDQLMALRWIRDNIAAFGGDPDNITIGGQSGGSLKVCMMAGSPAGKGLFRRVIAHSGLKWQQHFKTLEDAEEEGKAYLEACGIDPEISAEELRALPPTSFLLNVQARVPGEMICDGYYIPHPVLKDCLTEYAKGTDFICGTCLGEADPFAGTAFSGAEEKTFGKDAFYALYREILGPLYEKYDFEKLVTVTDKDAYRTARVLATKGLAKRGRVNFSRNLMAARLFGSHMKKIDPSFRNYVFLFSHFLPIREEDQGGPYDPEKIMAYHSSDLFYAFGSLREDLPPTRPWKDTDYALAEQMTDAFSSFMKDGDPGWPSSEDGSYAEFGDELIVRSGFTGPVDALLREFVSEEYEI